MDSPGSYEQTEVGHEAQDFIKMRARKCEPGVATAFYQRNDKISLKSEEGSESIKLSDLKKQ
jgi:hypothetical protein